MIEFSEKIDLSKVETFRLELFLKFSYTVLERYEEKKEKLQFEEGPFVEESLIPLFEQALNKTYQLLNDIKEKGATHKHMHNTATIFYKLLNELNAKYHHYKILFSDLLNVIIDDGLERCEALETAFRPIYDVLRSTATKKEKALLLKPYWFDFQNTYSSTLNIAFYTFAKNYNELYDLVLEEYLKRRINEKNPEENETIDLAYDPLAGHDVNL